MPNLWLCFWVNTQLEKLHSLSIFLKAVIQVIIPPSLPCFLSLTHGVCVHVHAKLELLCIIVLISLFPLYFAIGAHIGPEPTTYRFVVVMVFKNLLCFDEYYMVSLANSKIIHLFLPTVKSFIYSCCFLNVFAFVLCSF